MAAARPRPLVLAAVAVLSVAGCATAPPPMVIGGDFADRAPAAAAGPALATTGPRCRIHVAALTDARRASDILGMMGRQALKSPPDATAWLRTVVGGLGARGFEVDFGDRPAPGAIEARISLVTAWVATVSTNFNASAVLHLSATRPGAPPLDRDYRGGLTRLNWAGGADEVKRMVDLSLARALDQMAVDLRPMCAAQG